MGNNKTVLVTGGAGFIGSHLVDVLVGLGYKVRVIDNFLTGRRENLNAGAEFHYADIRNIEEIRPHFEGIDFVFHAAALPRIQTSIHQPKLAHDINVNGTFNVLLAAKESSVKKVIFSSSSSVYGDQKVLPLKEHFDPKPLSPYGLQKYIGELYCKTFTSIYALKTVILRYFNVYGPRMSENGAYPAVFAVFLNQRRNGQPLTIMGDGEQTRSFTHVSDVVRANVLAMESERAVAGEIINICADRPCSVNEAAKLVGGPTVNLPARLAEVHHSNGDATLAKELLGWQASITLDKGLEELKSLYA